MAEWVIILACEDVPGISVIVRVCAIVFACVCTYIHACIQVYIYVSHIIALSEKSS